VSINKYISDRGAIEELKLERTRYQFHNDSRYIDYKYPLAEKRYIKTSFKGDKE